MLTHTQVMNVRIVASRTTRRVITVEEALGLARRQVLVVESVVVTQTEYRDMVYDRPGQSTNPVEFHNFGALFPSPALAAMLDEVSG